MPFARLTLIPAPTPEMAQQVATDLTEIVARDLSKQHELTSVLVETPRVSMDHRDK
jgi:phenylpyruvate tautomerase PptA (4-oxalocrotonate tautomerase family)